MYGKMKDHLSKTLAEIKEAGLYKGVRTLHLRNAGHPQGAGSSHLRLLQD